MVYTAPPPGFSFLQNLSGLIFSIIPAGQSTLELVDPETGLLEQYQLVKLPRLSPGSVSPESRRAADSQQPSRGRLARRSRSASVLHAPSPRAREQSPWDSRAMESASILFDVSLDPLEDISGAWSVCLAGRDVRSPLYPQMKKPLYSGAQPRARASSSSSAGGTPSLLEDNSAESFSAPAPCAFPDTSAQQLFGARARVIPTPSAERETSTGALVGLGFSGMTKADGSPFDGLGSLPLPRARSPEDTDTEGRCWAWAHEAHEARLRDVSHIAADEFARPVVCASTPARLPLNEFQAALRNLGPMLMRRGSPPPQPLAKPEEVEEDVFLAPGVGTRPPFRLQGLAQSQGPVRLRGRGLGAQGTPTRQSHARSRTLRGSMGSSVNFASAMAAGFMVPAREVGGWKP